MNTLSPGPDGYYHPTTEDEILALVLQARDQKKQVRVRGSAHSVARAIYPDGPEPREDVDSANVNVMLDRFRAVKLIPVSDDPDHLVAEVEAGCNLGKNPYDPTHTSTWKNSLNWQLQQAGYALDDMGGISHQTVSGFLSTGSSGGSLTYSIGTNLLRLRFIDGTGAIHDVSRDDPDPSKRELFNAAGVSMGLLGILTKVWFRARKTYNLFGSQITSTTEAASIDLYGTGTPQRPSLEGFLRQAPYTRLMWWPQHGFDRMQVWQATRMDPLPGFQPNPYLELGRTPQLAALAGSLFYTIIGNLDAIATVPYKLDDWYARLDGTLEGAPDLNGCRAPTPRLASGQKYTVKDVLGFFRERFEASLTDHATLLEPGSPANRQAHSLIQATGQSLQNGLSSTFASAITKLVELLLAGSFTSPLAQPLAEVLESTLPWFIKDILSIFVSDGSEPFWDTWMCGLPMDNQMDDRLWPTTFTELWIPVDKTIEVMKALRELYSGSGDPVLAYEHTGAFSCEIYAAQASSFWMSPSYGTDVIRIDVFWFGKNDGSPSDSFYPRFWKALKKFGFLPHWGKVLPPASPEWAHHYREHLPKFGDFLALRERLDPDRIFLTKYWQQNLGIE